MFLSQELGGGRLDGFSGFAAMFLGSKFSALSMTLGMSRVMDPAPGSSAMMWQMANWMLREHRRRQRFRESLWRR